MGTGAVRKEGMMVVKSIASDIAENPTTHSTKPNNISSMSHTMMLSNYIDALTDGMFLLSQSFFYVLLNTFIQICLTVLSHPYQRGKILYLRCMMREDTLSLN